MAVRIYDKDGNDITPQKPVGELTPLCEIGGDFDEVNVTLSFYSKELDRHVITSALGIEPTKAWNAHERHPIGNGKSGTTRSVDYGKWYHTVELASNDPNMLLRHLFDITSNDLSVWAALTNKLDAWVTVSGHLNNWNRELDIDPSNLQLLAERGLFLKVDVYFDGEDDDDKSAQQGVEPDALTGAG